jgi:hypothetical protein
MWWYDAVVSCCIKILDKSARLENPSDFHMLQIYCINFKGNLKFVILDKSAKNPAAGLGTTKINVMHFLI